MNDIVDAIVKRFILLAAAILVISMGIAFQAGSPKRGPKKVSLLEQALDYKKLALIDLELRRATDLGSTFCRNIDATVTPHEVVAKSKLKPVIRVYIDPSAIALVKNHRKGELQFPVGTLFVKEKFHSSQSSKPHLLTAMKKARLGKGADKWDYKMIDIKTRKPTKPAQPSPSCLQCHSRYSATDGISPETIKVMKTQKGKR